MVLMTEARLERRARWAYELGRAAWASHALFLVLPLLIVARWIGRPPGLVFVLGGGVAAIALGAAMVHRRYARAVLAGVLAGLPAFALPVIIRGLGIVRLGPMTLDPCIPASIVAGILAGAYLTTRTVEEKHRLSYWLVAAFVAAPLGTLGCSVVGGAGVLGLVTGLAVGTIPLVLGTGARRS
jgi:hypothetical protein